MICIPRSQVNKLKDAFKSGDITLAKLFTMTDSEAHTVLANYVGEDFARVINAEFEKAKLSKQKDALTKFVQKLFPEPKQIDIRSDFEKKIDRMDKALTGGEAENFMKDLANQKLGTKTVTEEEVKKMVELRKDFEAKRELIKPESPIRSDERIAYGLAVDDFKQYVAELKNAQDNVSIGENIKHKILNPGELLYDIGSNTKSILASLDNSFFGSQGVKELLSPWSGGTLRWAKNFVKSFPDIAKQLVVKSSLDPKKAFDALNDPVMKAIRADIWSRPNALNGKYQAAKGGYGLGVTTEEAFPTSFPERIPGLGRLFKASEVAFNGAALRMRADLADSLIRNAEKNGINTTDKLEVDGLSKLTQALTGRGDIGKLGVMSKEINALLFSIKFLKSNIDTLTAPFKYVAGAVRGETEGLYAKKVAATKTLEIITSLAAVLAIAEVVSPGSVDFDPRRGKLGQIKIMNHWYDISGGQGAIIALASRLVPTKHNGKWGFWYASPTTGKFTQLNSNEFKATTALDIGEQFVEGKLSPAAGVLRDLWKGRDYQGRTPTAGTILSELVTPLPIQSFLQIKDPTSADGLLALISEALGFRQTPTVYTKPKK